MMNDKNKYSCKGVSKKQNDMTFQRYKDNLIEVSIQLRFKSRIRKHQMLIKLKIQGLECMISVL